MSKSRMALTATHRTRARPLALFTVAVGLTTLSLTACGSSTPTTAAPPASTQTTIAATPQVGSSSQVATAGSPPISTLPTTTQPASSTQAPQPATAAADLSTKGCGAIKVADAQALVKAAVTKVEFSAGDAELDPTHSFQCAVNNPALLIEVHPEDASKQTYQQDIAAENVPAVPLAGVGDSAVWTAVSLTPGTYTAAPDLYAHKGQITCEVQGSGQGLTIPMEPGMVPAITKANAAAFAAKLGVLCNEVFGGLG